MNVVEYLDSLLNSQFFYYFYIGGAFFLIGIGVLIYVGIQTKGKVILIDFVFKHKHFDRDVLKTRYKIQAVYTFVIGVALLIVLLTVPYDGVIVTSWLVLFAIIDGIYDYLAIKSSSNDEVSQEKTNEEKDSTN